MKKIISGKVREVYDLENNELVIVTTDRISAFDVILPTLIPDKGKVLNAISNFWFTYTSDIVKNQMISTDLKDMPQEFQKEEFEDRTIKVKKLKMLPYEFIVRGYMFGSMWSAYKKGEEFGGYQLREGYRQAEKLDKPILTPSTKATEGHDIYITCESVEQGLGTQLSKKIEDVCMKLYEKCYDYALANGIIIADTKFEFGLDEDGELVLADEVFTPDSSRFWNLSEYKIGESPKSFDKQFIRDWLISTNQDGDANIKSIPEEIVQKTAEVYQNCKNRLLK